MKSVLTVLFGFSFVFNLLGQKDSIEFLISNYDYTGALELVNVELKEKSDPELIFTKANIFKALHMTDSAINCLEKLLQFDTLSVKYIVELATSYQKLGNFKKAIHYMNRALQLQKNNLFLIQQTGMIHYLANNYTNALEYYSTAYKIDSAFYNCSQMAKTYDKMEIMDSAILYFQKSLELSNTDFYSAHRLATLLFTQKKTDEALLVTENYLIYDSLNLPMLRLNGQLYFSIAEYDKSLFNFDKCIALNDSTDFTIKHLGYNHYMKENYDTAAGYLEKAFANDTLNADLSYMAGVSNINGYYPYKGIDYLHKTLEIITPKPIFVASIYQMIGRVHADGSVFDKALTMYQNAYKVIPNDTLLPFKIARIYDRMNNHTLAVKYYRIFLTLRPDKKENSDAKEGLQLSYFDYTITRLDEIKEKQFWESKEK